MKNNKKVITAILIFGIFAVSANFPALAATPLAAPSSPNAVCSSDGGIVLRWDQQPQADGYYVYCNGEEIADCDTNDYEGEYRKMNCVYTYSVAAYKYDGSISAKTDIKVHTPGFSKPSEKSVAVRNMIGSKNGKISYGDYQGPFTWQTSASDPAGTYDYQQEYATLYFDCGKINKADLPTYFGWWYGAPNDDAQSVSEELAVEMTLSPIMKRKSFRLGVVMNRIMRSVEAAGYMKLDDASFGSDRQHAQKVVIPFADIKEKGISIQQDGTNSQYCDFSSMQGVGILGSSEGLPDSGWHNLMNLYEAKYTAIIAPVINVGSEDDDGLTKLTWQANKTGAAAEGYYVLKKSNGKVFTVTQPTFTDYELTENESYDIFAYTDAAFKYNNKEYSGSRVSSAVSVKAADSGMHSGKPTVLAEKVLYACDTKDTADRLSIDTAARGEYFDNLAQETDAIRLGPNGETAEAWQTNKEIPADHVHFVVRNMPLDEWDCSGVLENARLELYIARSAADTTDDANISIGLASARRTTGQHQLIMTDITGKLGTATDTQTEYKKITIPLSEFVTDGTLVHATPLGGWLGDYYGTINDTLTDAFRYKKVTGIAIGIRTADSALPAIKTIFHTAGIKIVKTIDSPVIAGNEISAGKRVISWTPVAGAEKYYVYNKTQNKYEETVETIYTSGTRTAEDTYEIYAVSGDMVSEPAAATLP